MQKRFSQFKTFIQKKTKLLSKKVTSFIDGRPLASFFILLGALVALIVLGNLLRAPKTQKQTAAPVVKTVNVYRIGTASKMSLQAQVEKSGVVTITSLTGGVVQGINVQPGTHVGRGNNLVSMSSNYQGGNAFSTQRQLAATQYQNVNETYPTQKDLINKQKDATNKTDDNSDRLRDISAQSVGETKDLISLNDSILSTLDKNIADLESGVVTPAPGDPGKDEQILSIKQVKSQLIAGNNQLKSALRSTEYQTNTDNSPSKLSDLQKDITLKQLELQEKALDLNREISRLQLQLARINEAMMFPSAPFSATVQRVFVKVGQAVNPGTPLVVLSQDIEDDPIVAIAYVSREVAQKISLMEPSVLHIGNFTFHALPSYVTQDAIQGSLYGIYFPLPDNYNKFLTEKGYIRVDVPIGYVDTTASVPFVPIDVVYQTQQEAYVFVVNKGKVESRTVKLGDVYGRFVQIESGLKNGDVIILDRTVIAGENVKVVQ